MKRVVLVLLMAGCLLAGGLAQTAGAAPNVQGLALPASAFRPATSSGPVVVPNSEANTGYFNWLHAVHYNALHRVTGIGEDAQWHPTSASSDFVEFLYLGSIFKSASDAASAYADTTTYPISQYGAAVQSCPRGLPSGCKRLRLAESGPPAETHWHDVFAVGACLLEMSAIVPNTLQSQPGVVPQAKKTLAAIDAAALRAATTTCAQPSGPFGFTLSRVTVLDRQGHARSSFKVLEPFTISFSWNVQHLAGKATAAVTFKYQVPAGAGWKTAQTVHERVVAVNGVNPYQKDTQFAAAGRYRIAVTVSIKTVTRHGAATVTITR